VQTEAQHAAIRRLIDGGSSMALALMLLPVRSLAADRKYLFALIVLLSGVAATAGLTGCGYKRQWLLRRGAADLQHHHHQRNHSALGQRDAERAVGRLLGQVTRRASCTTHLKGDEPEDQNGNISCRRDANSALKPRRPRLVFSSFMIGKATTPSSALRVCVL